MKNGSARRHVVPGMYATIVVAAILIDLSTDRSGGALSLATLLVGVVAAVCFIAGQVSSRLDAKRVFSYWAIGMLLILLGLVAFAAKGGDAPKEGELVFTYAMLVSAPPVSLLIPFVPSSTMGHEFGDVVARTVVIWIFVAGVGSLQWAIVRTLVRKIRAAGTAGAES